MNGEKPQPFEVLGGNSSSDDEPIGVEQEIAKLDSDSLKKIEKVWSISLVKISSLYEQPNQQELEDKINQLKTIIHKLGHHINNDTSKQDLANIHDNLTDLYNNHNGMDYNKVTSLLLKMNRLFIKVLQAQAAEQVADSSTDDPEARDY